MYVFNVSERRYLLRLVRGEELRATLHEFAEERKIGCGVVRGLGAAEKAELTFYDLGRKEYVNTPVNEEVEIAGLVGNFSRGPEGEAVVHIHTALGRRDGSSLTGHVESLIVGGTLELDVEVFAGTLQRRFDQTIGLSLQESYLPE